MSTCLLHALAFGADFTRPETIDVHLLSDKAADVCDLTCPQCGDMLFVYYRHVPREGGSDVRRPAATPDAGADNPAQPHGGQEQQTKGDPK